MPANQQEHIPCGPNVTLCGSRNIVHLIRTVDCQKCRDRMDALLAACLDVTQEKPESLFRLRRVLEKLGVTRQEIPL